MEVNKLPEKQLPDTEPVRELQACLRRLMLKGFDSQQIAQETGIPLRSINALVKAGK